MHARIWGAGTDLTGTNKENGEANGGRSILRGQPLAGQDPLAAEDNLNEAGVRRDGEHLLPDPWRGSTNPVMVREIQ